MSNRYDMRYDRVDSGRVVFLCDGIATVVGLRAAKAGEVVFFKKRRSRFFKPDLLRGLVLNLNFDNVFVMILGNETLVGEGGFVFRSNSLFNINTSLQMFGRVLNSLGRCKETRTPFKSSTVECSGFIEKKAPGIIERIPVNIPLRTGLKAIDSLVPVGRGQRELIIGDRQTGKTSLGLDTILNHSRNNNIFTSALRLDDLRSIVWFVYAAIGQKQSSISQISSTLRRYSSGWFTAIVSATAAEPAPLQFLAPFSSCTLGEFIRDVLGGHCVVIYDDLSKHAVAYRQMSLLLRRPPGREAFPGDVFYVHSRLLERAGALRNINYYRYFISHSKGKRKAFINTKTWRIWNFCLSFPRGTLTAFPIIETQGGDVSAYIPTNVISITDGQIFLETELFYKGIRPAINVGLSVSRVGSVAQPKLSKKVVGSLKIDLAQFREIEGFAKLGASLDNHTKRLLIRGENLIEILKQKLNSPLSTIEQNLSIFLGVGYSSSWLNSILRISKFLKNSFISRSRLRSSWFEFFRLFSVNFSVLDLNSFLVSFLYFIRETGVTRSFGFISNEVLTEKFSDKFPVYFFDDIIIAFLIENSILLVSDGSDSVSQGRCNTMLELSNVRFLNSDFKLIRNSHVRSNNFLEKKGKMSSNFVSHFKTSFSVFSFFKCRDLIKLSNQTLNLNFQKFSSNKSRFSVEIVLVLIGLFSKFFSRTLSLKVISLSLPVVSLNKLYSFSKLILESFLVKFDPNINITALFRTTEFKKGSKDFLFTFNTFQSQNLVNARFMRFTSFSLVESSLLDHIYSRDITFSKNYFFEKSVNQKFSFESVFSFIKFLKLTSVFLDSSRFETAKFNFVTMVYLRLLGSYNLVSDFISSKFFCSFELLHSVFFSVRKFSVLKTVFFLRGMKKVILPCFLTEVTVFNLKCFSVFLKKLSLFFFLRGGFCDSGLFLCNIFSTGFLIKFVASCWGKLEKKKGYITTIFASTFLKSFTNIFYSSSIRVSNPTFFFRLFIPRKFIFV